MDKFDMLEDIAALEEKALRDVEATGTVDALEELRVNLIGRSGSVTKMLKSISSVEPSLSGSARRGRIHEGPRQVCENSLIWASGVGKGYTSGRSGR